jgi:Rod binding domain-containing protein
MNINSLNSNIPPLEGVGKFPVEFKQKQLKQASVDFESMLLQQMFQSMQKSLESGRIVGKGLSGSVYSEFLVGAISKDMASNQSLGLGEQLYKQVLKREPEVQKLENLQKETLKTMTHDGLKIGHDIPLENLRRGLGAIQMVKAQPLMTMGTESVKNADNIDRSKAKL